MFNVKCKMKNVYYPFTDSNLSARNTVRGDTGRTGLGRHAGLPETPHGHILNFKF